MRLAALLLALLLAAPAWAFIGPDEVLPDPAQEARARAITSELRCVVCRGQALDESDAPIARDLRLIVREQIVEGRSDSEIFRYLTDRYGEFVLYRPPFTLANAALWLAGPALLLVGGTIAFVFVRRRSTAPAPDRSALSDEERGRLARLLED
jgi:cytochrome c-type biogenesis protein CcmH